MERYGHLRHGRGRKNDGTCEVGIKREEGNFRGLDRSHLIMGGRRERDLFLFFFFCGDGVKTYCLRKGKGMPNSLFCGYGALHVVN